MTSYQKLKQEIKNLKNEINNFKVLEIAFKNYIRADNNFCPDIKKECLKCFLNHTTNEYYKEEIKKGY